MLDISAETVSMAESTLFIKVWKVVPLVELRDAAFRFKPEADEFKVTDVPEKVVTSPESAPVWKVKPVWSSS
jgi:hypothetical protein